jgi:hypothetical protein
LKYLININEYLEDEPIYSTQRIIQSDFDDKQMFENFLRKKKAIKNHSIILEY